MGEFAAIIDLTADFEAMSISGCVGCAGPVALTGVFTDGATGLTEEFASTSDVQLRLGATPISSNGNFRGRNMTLSAPGYAYTGTDGSWGGQFSNIQNAVGDPRLVAGTFGGEAATSNGSEVVFIGAYIAPAR